MQNRRYNNYGQGRDYNSFAKLQNLEAENI